MEKIKNIITSVLIILVVTLGYFLVFGNKQFTKDNQPTVNIERGSKDNFAKNQDCLKYKDEIAAKLESKTSSWGKASLEQIFYSPKQNSCLYVEYAENNGDILKGEIFYSRRMFDILDNGPSSHPLADCYVMEIGSKCETFDKNLAEYKNQ